MKTLLDLIKMNRPAARRAQTRKAPVKRMESPPASASGSENEKSIIEEEDEVDDLL